MPPSFLENGGYYEDGRFAMYNYHVFADVFDFNLSNSYSRKQVEGIEGCRKKFEGLFVDKVLKLVGIKKPRTIYPPRSETGIENLHAEIVKDDGIADSLKLSLLYYILLDCGDQQGQKDGLLEDRIVKKFYLPKSYQLLMKGLWYMDRGDFMTALQYLTHPSLVPTFEDDILDTLVRFSDPEDLSLPLAYYHTVQPTLKTSKAVDSLFTALATASVTQAFYFARAQPENIHKQLFESLITEVLGDYEASTSKGDRSVELVNLPFSDDEEEWFEEYLEDGEGRSLKRAPDTLMMRKIGIGKFGEALKINGTYNKTLDGLNWDSIQDALLDGLGPRLDLERSGE